LLFLTTKRYEIRGGREGRRDGGARKRRRGRAEEERNDRKERKERKEKKEMEWDFGIIHIIMF
jgi:hypothetical protein